MIEVILVTMTLATSDPRQDTFCRDARAVAHIIGEGPLLARARMGGAPKWKLTKTLECFLEKHRWEIEHGR